MTVGELIDILRQLPRDLEVVDFTGTLVNHANQNEEDEVQLT